jgi:type I restriction enzyme S subunit
VALENIIGGVGKLDETVELPVRSTEGPGTARVRQGDVLFGKLRPYLAKSWLVDRDAIASTELVGLRPRRGVEPRWLGYVALSEPLKDWAVTTSYGSKMPRTSWEALSGFQINVPALSEQRAIADFLDAETTRIDSLMSKKLSMRKLLVDRWDAQVRASLTRKDERRIPLKRRWQITDCKHRTPTYVEEGYPVVSPGDATPGELDLSRCHRFVDANDFLDLAEGHRRPRRGDIIYSRNASIGIASFVDTDEPFCMGQDVCLIRSDDQDQRFLTYALNTLGTDQLSAMKIGSTFSRINVAQIAEIDIPATPPSEQRQLADRLDTMSLNYLRLKNRFDDQVSVLRERREALITAAVTGQLEVPGVA